MATTSVPKLWPGETFVLLGRGPSLCAADVDYVQGKARVIAINAAYELAPWADVLYACDASFWRSRRGVMDFEGLKYSLEATPAEWGVQQLRNTGMTGLELDPSALRTGKNSGYQAINLAVHLGAARIILLGYDLRVIFGRHRFDNDSGGDPSLYPYFIERFPTLVEPLKAIGVEVVNCTTGSALTAFPIRPLRDVMLEVAA